jgi:transcriptional regulator PpsR
LESLGNVDAIAAAEVLAAACDLTLVLNSHGAILDVVSSMEDVPAEWTGKWLGRPWADTVTVESRPKIEAMLAEAQRGVQSRKRHVNHPAPRGPDLPIYYSLSKVGDDKLLAVGRDLRAMAALQQRLVAAQQSMERDYARMRSVETRYRLLFQVTAEPVLIVEAASGKIVEANPATGQLLGEQAKRIVGRTLHESFEPTAADEIRKLLAGEQTTGRPDNVRIRLQQRRDLLVYAAMFRQEALSFFLIRLLPIDDEPGAIAVASAKARLLEAVQSAPDAFVVTDPDGSILTANTAFLDLAQLANEGQARGESIERWLGRPGVDLNVLIANLRQHGAVRLFSTTLRGEYGATTEIEVSAAAVPSEEQPCFGFTIRSVSRRLPAEPRAGRELPRSMEQLTELVGRVPLKDLVRETADVIERMCIEAALELTGDNRASAAEILGLSRQSLYVKLHRYGLGDLRTDAEGG